MDSGTGSSNTPLNSSKLQQHVTLVFFDADTQEHIRVYRQVHGAQITLEEEIRNALGEWRPCAKENEGSCVPWAGPLRIVEGALALARDAYVDLLTTCACPCITMSTDADAGPGSIPLADTAGRAFFVGLCPTNCALVYINFRWPTPCVLSNELATLTVGPFHRAPYDTEGAPLCLFVDKTQPDLRTLTYRHMVMIHEKAGISVEGRSTAGGSSSSTSSSSSLMMYAQRSSHCMECEDLAMPDSFARLHTGAICSLRNAATECLWNVCIHASPYQCHELDATTFMPVCLTRSVADERGPKTLHIAVRTLCEQAAQHWLVHANTTQSGPNGHPSFPHTSPLDGHYDEELPSRIEVNLPDDYRALPSGAMLSAFRHYKNETSLPTAGGGGGGGPLVASSSSSSSAARISIHVDVLRECVFCGGGEWTEAQQGDELDEDDIESSIYQMPPGPTRRLHAESTYHSTVTVSPDELPQTMLDVVIECLTQHAAAADRLEAEYGLAPPPECMLNKDTLRMVLLEDGDRIRCIAHCEVHARPVIFQGAKTLQRIRTVDFVRHFRAHVGFVFRDFCPVLVCKHATDQQVFPRVYAMGNAFLPHGRRVCHHPDTIALLLPNVQRRPCRTRILEQTLHYVHGYLASGSGLNHGNTALLAVVSVPGQPIFAIHEDLEQLAHLDIRKHDLAAPLDMQHLFSAQQASTQFYTDTSGGVAESEQRQKAVASSLVGLPPQRSPSSTSDGIDESVGPPFVSHQIYVHPIVVREFSSQTFALELPYTSAMGEFTFQDGDYLCVVPHTSARPFITMHISCPQGSISERHYVDVHAYACQRSVLRRPLMVYGYVAQQSLRWLLKIYCMEMRPSVDPSRFRVKVSPGGTDKYLSLDNTTLGELPVGGVLFFEDSCCKFNRACCGCVLL